MSTGLECEFVNIGSQWWYVLERGDAPKLSWDWHEYANAWGPFSSEDDAHSHLRRNHANPGGSVTSTYTDIDEVNETLRRLIEQSER